MGPTAAIPTANKLKQLLDNGTVKQERVAWGRGFRNVIIINGKRYQYSGKHISKLLENKISLLYIDMPASSSNENIIINDILSLDAGDGVNSKRTKEERDARAKHRKKTISVNKIINHLKRFPKFYTAPLKTIFKGKGRIIALKPKRIGGIITIMDLPYLILQGYKQARKTINYQDYKINIKVSGLVINGETFWASTEIHSKDSFKQVFHEIMEKIESGLEKYDYIDLSSL